LMDREERIGINRGLPTMRSTKTTIYITTAVVEVTPLIILGRFDWLTMPCKTRSRAAVFMACLT
jgi:hypothetical protein